MPSQHSDARFAFGFCLLALRRATAGGGGAVGQAVLPLLRASEARWRELYLLRRVYTPSSKSISCRLLFGRFLTDSFPWSRYADASADVPEPWLGGEHGGGVEWL